jgi:hypothetical protein
MAEHIFIRVTAGDEGAYQNWEEVHNSCLDARAGFGITDGPFYKDATDANSALVHLVVEDMDRAMGWFKAPRFAEANAKVTLLGDRQLFFAKQR